MSKIIFLGFLTRRDKRDPLSAWPSVRLAVSLRLRSRSASMPSFPVPLRGLPLWGYSLTSPPRTCRFASEHSANLLKISRNHWFHIFLRYISSYRCEDVDNFQITSFWNTSRSVTKATGVATFNLPHNHWMLTLELVWLTAPRAIQYRNTECKSLSNSCLSNDHDLLRLSRD